MSWSCYLATPIDQAGDLQATVNTITQTLEGAGAIVYNPRSLIDRNPEGNAFAQVVHDSALAVADCLLAWLPTGVPSIGVPMEIERAAEMGKPVVIYGGAAAKNSPTIAARHLPVFTTVEGAVGALAGLLRDPTTDDLGLHVTEYLDRVQFEIERARTKHPRSDDKSWTTVERWFSIWAEEVWEAMAAWNDRRTPGEIRVELVQVGAMSMRLWRALGLDETES